MFDEIFFTNPLTFIKMGAIIQKIFKERKVSLMLRPIFNHVQNTLKATSMGA